MNRHEYLNRQGLFAVVTPRGVTMLETFANTPFSARANYLRVAHTPWVTAAKNGYTMGEFGRVATVMPSALLNALEEEAMPLIEFKPPQSAREWSLYSNEGAEPAAAYLSEKLTALIEEALAVPDLSLARAKRIRDEMYVMMNLYENLGARDTEPEETLVQLIEGGLGLPWNSLTR